VEESLEGMLRAAGRRLLVEIQALEL
jgi:hypothetical protein